MSHIDDELHTDLTKLVDCGQNFTVGTPTVTHNSTILVPTRRVVSILDYVSTAEDNPFKLADNVYVVYVRKFKKGEWIWARDSFHSPSPHYDGMRISAIYTEITGESW